MKTLGLLFGSETKVKIMKLFIFHQDVTYLIKDIAKRVKVDRNKVRRELSLMVKIGLVRRKRIKKGHSYIVNHSFKLLIPLYDFLTNTEPLQSKEIAKKIGKVGSIKLIITSGVFTRSPESRADLLIVGDGIKKNRLENTIKVMESEIGRELKYAYFSTDEFKYRLSMYDKLTRDILDYPHHKVLNKLGLE